MQSIPQQDDQLIDYLFARREPGKLARFALVGFGIVVFGAIALVLLAAAAGAAVGRDWNVLNGSDSKSCAQYESASPRYVSCIADREYREDIGGRPY